MSWHTRATFAGVQPPKGDLCHYNTTPGYNQMKKKKHMNERIETWVHQRIK